MKCPVCSSPNVYRYKLIDDVQIFQCRKCMIAFVDPKTPRKNTGHIYEFSDYQKREDQFRKRYENTTRLLKKFSPGKKVLEVGAGFGLLSSILSNQGYEVDALEPDVIPHYLKELPVTVIKKAFDPFAQEHTKKYDAIILYDVLEHIDEPKKTILLFKKLLKKNGIVFIQTPNYLSSMARMVKKWSWWMIEDHRFFFSKHALSLLFSKKIWKNRYYSTYEEWVDFKKNLDGNFTADKFGKYIFFAWWIPFYFLFRKLMWRAGKGGLIVTIYQKR